MKRLAHLNDISSVPFCSLHFLSFIFVKLLNPHVTLQRWYSEPDSELKKFSKHSIQALMLWCVPLVLCNNRGRLGNSRNTQYRLRCYDAYHYSVTIEGVWAVVPRPVSSFHLLVALCNLNVDSSLTSETGVTMSSITKSIVSRTVINPFSMNTNAPETERSCFLRTKAEAEESSCSLLAPFALLPPAFNSSWRTPYPALARNSTQICRQTVSDTDLSLPYLPWHLSSAEP